MADGGLDGQDRGILIELTTDIISAYVGNNAIGREDLPDLIRNVHSSLRALADESDGANRQPPAVSIKDSVTDEHIICLEDGKKFKSLKRHLRSQYNLSPEEYREKWGLPADYPMVAPSYARQRSKLAKKMGLGKARS